MQSRSAPTDLGSIISGIWRLDPAKGANSCLQQMHRVAKEEAGTSPLSLQLPVEFWRLTQVPEVLASPEGTSSSSSPVEFYCTLCSAAQIYRMPAGEGG